MYCITRNRSDFTRSEYAIAILKNFIIMTVINVNDTKPVALSISIDNSVRSKSTSTTFYK